MKSEPYETRTEEERRYRELEDERGEEELLRRRYEETLAGGGFAIRKSRASEALPEEGSRNPPAGSVAKR